MDPLSALRMSGLQGIPLPTTPAVDKPIPVVELEKLGQTQIGGGVSGPSGGNFSSVLGQMIQGVSDKQANAAEAVNGLITGQNVSLHQAVIAMEEASVSFQLMVEVRNKLLESYQELMRMQV